MLDYKQCDAFLAVAGTGSFDAASTQLSITPSAVTIRVQALEKSLGQLLIIRGKPCSLTSSGKKLFEYLQHQQRLEQDFLSQFSQQKPNHYYQVSIASNADSLATWLLPTLKDILIQNRILLEIKLDDQTHTYNLLENGTVNACISTEKYPMRGCTAQYIGTMRYVIVCTPTFEKKWFSHGISREVLKKVPAIIFNHKDQVHFNTLLNQYGLAKGTYPFHLIPSSESFLEAIRLDLGYGFVPQIQLAMDSRYNEKELFIEPLRENYVDVPLYWHHWQQQSKPLQQLTEFLLMHIHQYLK